MAVNRADHDKGWNEKVDDKERERVVCEMNLLLKESHFLQPRGGHYFLAEAGPTLCYIDSRRDCGKGLCCEASSREGLGKHLERNKREETYNSCTVPT